VVPGRSELALISLGAGSLAFHRLGEVVIATTLVVLLLLLKREDVPSPWSTTCFPLP
jgi:hypothetical protein